VAVAGDVEVALAQVARGDGQQAFFVVGRKLFHSQAPR
jgi:hypothetical protein